MTTNAQGQGVVRHRGATSIEFLLLDEFGIFPRIIGLDPSRSVEPTGRRREPAAAGTCSAASLLQCPVSSCGACTAFDSGE